MMTAMNFVKYLVMAGLTISAYAQTAQITGNDWSPKSKRAAEDLVARRIDELRASANRPALKRVDPSVMESELVCTAAFTDRKMGDPLWGGLLTYDTDDVVAETDALKEMILGKSYPKKKRPRYSVIIERNAKSKTDHIVYTVGVARRPSAVMEFFGPVMSDVPFKGMNEWKKSIVPECRNDKNRREAYAALGRSSTITITAYRPCLLSLRTEHFPANGLVGENGPGVGINQFSGVDGYDLGGSG